MGAGSSAQLPHAQADISSPQFAVYRRLADKLETEVGKFGTRDLDADQGKDVRITSAPPAKVRAGVVPPAAPHLH